jgi:hypothetical protein
MELLNFLAISDHWYDFRGSLARELQMFYHDEGGVVK